MSTDNLARIRHHIESLKSQPPIPPWESLGAHAVGGLEAVGFADNSDLLLVVSSQGRGVIDCGTGERVARDREAPDTNCPWYDETRLTAIGIGPLSDTTIRIAGMCGGGLPISTEDAWRLELIAPTWPDYRVILCPPYKSILDDLDACVQIADRYEFRAYGFSDTGRSFIVATSSDVDIYRR